MTVPQSKPPAQRVADALEKPALDTRTYRVIRLANDLEILLIHDPETDKAAAAMDVNVGSFSDSEDMPGIAHAVEHLLFLGTEKYPGENDYNSYLTKYAGNSNAFTASTSTNYFFELSASSTSQSNGSSNTGQPVSKENAPLYGALDRFSQFFINPLFLEDSLDRELRAVDSENKKNLQSDVWRLNQLNKSTSSKEHPFHKFSTGNYKLLHDDPLARGVKIRDEFIKFYQTHYSANRMKLTVLGVESLDELESWVTDLFSDVPNKNLSKLRWDGIPVYDTPNLGTQTFAKPVMDQRMLSLDFPYPDEEDLFASQPARYSSHLIGHEGPGSILAYLKEKGWASGLSAGVSPACPGTSFFNIDIRLTEDGLKSYPKVLKAVFQYIALLREQPPYEWIVDEMKRLAEVEFKFRQKSPASRTVSHLSGMMQKPLPREWLLSGQSLIREFDAVNIRRGIDALRPDNFRFTIVSQNYPGDWNLKEQWYGTEYSYEKIPADLMSELTSAASSSSSIPKDLHLPAVNEFVPQRLDVEKRDVKEPSLAPTLIRNDSGVRTWFKKDDQFWVPKANIFICLRTPHASSSPLLAVLAAMYTSLVSDSLEEYAYDAELAGLSYSLTEHSTGMDIAIQGYNDKMAVLLEKVLLTMRDLQIKPERFEILKERKMRAYKNAEYLDPFRQIPSYTRWLMREGSWINADLLPELSNVSAEDVGAFFPELLRQMHIEVLVHGNVNREDALEISSLVQTLLRKPAPLPPAQWPTRRTILVPQGKSFVYQRELKNKDNVNHCLEYTLFCGAAADYAQRARVLLFEKLADEPCFDTLRTKEQLGYIVGSGSVNFSTVMGWRIVVQSERKCGYLEERADAFLMSFRESLEKMDPAEFEANKVGLVNRRLERLKNLGQESARFWAHLTAETLDFELVHKDVKAIEPLTKSDILAFFDTYISPASPQRAKLSVHLIAQGSSATTSNGDSNGDVKDLSNGSTAALDGTTAVAKTATNGSTTVAGKAVLIDDVKVWKDSLPLSAGPRPVKALREFEESGSKL